AGASANLQRLIGHAPQHFRGEHLAAGALDRIIVGAAVDDAGGQIDHRLGGPGLDHHAGNLVLDEPKLADGPAELAPRHCVRNDQLDQGFRAADAAGGQPEPTVVQDPHGHFEAVTYRAEHVFGRYAHVFEINRSRGAALDAELVLLGTAFDTVCALDDERRDSIDLVAVFGGFGLGKDREQIGDAAVGDPHLVAI